VRVRQPRKRKLSLDANSSRSIGTSLLSTIYASAVASYLTTQSHVRSLAAAPQVHGETTAFSWAAGVFGVGFLLALLILPSRCEARPAKTVTALARHAIGNCHHDETVEGAAVSDARGSSLRTKPSLLA
jgi:hypothetical protein